MLDRKIEYFIEVVEKGSFSSAVRSFLLSQATISQQITLLENELNIKLIGEQIEQKSEFDAIKLTRDIPEGSNMVRSEDKLKVILPYAAKRQIKILRNKKK